MRSVRTDGDKAKMKQRAQKRTGGNGRGRERAKARKAKATNGQPTIQDWTEAELRAQDRSVTGKSRETRKIEAANGQRPAIREGSEEELRAQDRFVIGQARETRKAEAANGDSLPFRQWSEAELHAQDQFVIRQAGWRKGKGKGKGKGRAGGSGAADSSTDLTGTSEGDGSLPEADREFSAPQAEIHGQDRKATKRAISQRASGKSDSPFSGLNWELIQNLPVGLALISPVNRKDVRTWQIAAANRVAGQIIGGSLADFLLTRVARSFPFQQKMKEIYESIVERRGTRDLHWHTCEIGGVRRTYSVTGFGVPPRYMGLLMQDVTAHWGVRNALLEHKTRYEAISHAIKTFLWKGDPETLQTKWVSSEAENVLGYWPERWSSISNFWLDRIDPQDREMVERTIREEAASRGARFDFRMKAAGGQTTWLHAVVHLGETATGQPELTGVMVDITARRQAEEASHELSRKLLRSQDEERRHVARELHDSLGQYLSVLGMNIGTLARTVPGMSEHHEAIFAETTDLLETCSRELRTLSYLMHPPMLDEVGLVPALKWYATGFSERSKIQVKMDAKGMKTRLPNLVEMAFFRITQEALTNIYRHSQSKTAEIGLQDEDGGVTLKIGDSGSGLDASVLEGVASGNGGAKGVGIRGMSERMREMGGTLTVASSKSGTVISAHIPRTARAFEEKDQDEQDARHKTQIMNAG